MLLASLLAWVAAYQYKTTYMVEVGGLRDDAYVSGFHAKEVNPNLDYRWTGSASTIRLPGIGN